MFSKRHSHQWAPENINPPRLRFKQKILAPLAGKFLAVTIYPYIFIDSSIEDCPEWIIKRNLAFHWQITQHGTFRFYLSFSLYYMAGLCRWKKHKPALKSVPFFSEACEVQFDRLTSNEIYQLCKDDGGLKWCQYHGKGLKVIENESGSTTQE